MKEIASCDWVIEVVVERLDIKKSVFSEVEKYRKPGTLITSNTSGIPIHMMLDGRSDDFKKHFCGTHFFNPPRYLRLLEIIPTAQTDPEVVDFLMRYGDLYLGKTTVLCKDTPAFIANRIGVFGMMAIMNAMEKLQLNIDEIDALTGPVIGRPKSATFRTADVVGIDTLVKVAKGVYENCPDDEAGEFYRLFHYNLFSYISHRIPEITGELYRVDDGMMAGFGWEIGAFESWDVLGVGKTTAAMKNAGFTVAPWIDEMLESGATDFYKVEN